MIQDGDRIGIGVSGGKDSLALMYCLKTLQRFYPKKFELVAITISLGNEGFDIPSLIDIYKSLNIQYHIEDTSISKVVFDVRKEKNPCSLCSNMKRGAIHNTAKKLGCNKVAFAHHRDDVIETLLLSLFYEGRIHTFSPVTYLDRTDITLIRPFIYIEEKMIRSYIDKKGIYPIASGCKADGKTKRHYIKELIITLMKENKHIKDNLSGAIQRSRINGWHPPL
ncbi:MAG: tRNA 2-thiocytidine biosynthesis protein TtcA [Clostridiaceae bacterium]|nr:tRNA 2-thiocytidine biosynthesis protein TtcA [Clostridiaceae bacterium]